MTSFADAVALSAHDEADSAWNRLAFATPQPDPFCAGTAWQLSFREAIDPSRGVVLRHCDDGLIQLALHSSGDRAVLGPIERQWLFGCNLLGPAAPDLLEMLLADKAVRETTKARALVISGLDAEAAASLRRRFGDRYSLRRFRAGVQCAASLEGGLDDFLARRSANHRRNLRRSSKQASQAGVRFERLIPRSTKEAAAIFTRMLAVERASWKGIGHCGMDEPHMSRFYSAMVRRLLGCARIVLATLDDRDVGYIFGGVAAGIYRGQQFSFDTLYSGLSIGNLLQAEQIQWLCEERVRRYDMGPLLGPSMEYKYHWTELSFPIEAWMIDLS